jgi:hypothetical protein
MWVAIFGAVILGVTILGTVVWAGAKIVVACQCALSGTTVTASVAEGTRYCTVVPIPKDWSVAPEYPVALDGLYRAAAGGGVLFSLQNPYTAKHLAISEKYWIDLEHRGKIRIATDAEWDAAPEIPDPLVGTPSLIKIPKRSVGLVTEDNDVLSFNGYQLPKSGDIAMGTFWSPGDRYLVTSSIDGWCERGPAESIGKAAYDGPFFIDIYRLWTGRRLATIKGRWCDWTPSATLGELRWISEWDLVFPFGRKKRDIIVCRFSE